MKIKALMDFKYFNNSGHFEVKKGDEVEIDDELAKDFIRQGLVEEIKIMEEAKPLIKTEEVKAEPLVKIKKHKEGD